LRRYLREGFRRGMPPTSVSVMARKADPIMNKVKPIDLMSPILNLRYLSPLRTTPGIITEKRRKHEKPISILICNVFWTGMAARAMKIEKNTINEGGEKIWFFSILLLLRELIKLCPGYILFIKLFNHFSSILMKRARSKLKINASLNLYSKLLHSLLVVS
jgi:hypothetical protein